VHTTPLDKTLGLPIGSAQWRREAPPRRLRSTPTPSSVSAGGGPKDDVIYIGAAPTLTPWTSPDLLLPPTTVETLNY
jgi:hypothetical protein